MTHDRWNTTRHRRGRTRTRGRRMPFVTAGLALLALTAPAPALADVTNTLDFDALAVGTAIDTEYAAQGISFTTAVPATGLPIATNVGGSAHSGSAVAQSSCFGCEFVPHTMKAVLSTLASGVSLRAGIDADTCTWDVPLRLEARGADGSIVGSQSLSVPASGYHTAMNVVTGVANIASFTLRTTAPGDAGCRFGIDDVSITGPDVPPPPDFSLDTTTGVAELRQGASTTVPITVNRFNGSNGNINFAVTGLPSGVSGAFAPNPLTGTGGATMLTLNATDTAPLVATPTTVGVAAAPAGGAVGPATRAQNFMLRVVPNWTLHVAPNPIVVPSCGSGSSTIYVNRAIGFPGAVSLSRSGLASGLSASISPATSTPPGSGALSTLHELRITKVGTGGMADSTLTINSSSGSLPAVAQSIAVHRVAGSITSFEPTVADAPRDLHAGTSVTIHGTGLCPGSRVRFGNPLADVTPSPLAFGSGGTSVTVQVPRLATSGPITVVSPDGTMSSPGSLTVRTARSTEGFAFDNYDHPGTSFSDLEATFGSEDTNISVDLCWPFGCDVTTPIPNPLTYLFIAIADEALAGEGSCWGISVTSQQIMTGRVPIARFAPAGATNPFQLNAATGPASALRTHIRRWHVVQLSSEFIQSYVSTAASNPVIGVSAIRNELRGELAAGRNPILALRNGGGGHVLVVHDLRDTPEGGFELDVYDSNIPYGSDEEGGDGAVHADRMARSTVTMSAAGHWIHRGAYSGGAWSGGLSSFIQVPFGDIPRDPTLPTSISGLLSLIVPFAADGSVEQIRDDHGHTLLNADGTANENPLTGIPGATVFRGLTGGNSRPVYAVPAGTPVVEELAARRGATYGHGLVGPGFAAKVDGLQGSGRSDLMRFDARAGAIDLDPAAPAGAMHVSLARSERDGDQRSVELAIAGADAGRQHVALGRGDDDLDYTAGGSSTVQASIAWTGSHGRPGSVRLPAVHLTGGDRLTIAPKRWSRLDETTLVLTVRGRSGALRMRRSVEPTTRSDRWVHHASIAARTVHGNRRRVVVRSSLGRLPRGTRVMQVLEVRRGGTLVKRVVRTLHGVRAQRAARTWTVDLRFADGRYSLRAGTTVIAPGRAVTTSTASARRAFRAR